MPPNTPPHLPGYRIIRPLGRGGMATVYLAEQQSLGREVAIKVLDARQADDVAAVERFLREGRTAAALVHRHIVGIHDVGSVGGLPYMAMEFLPAGSVAERLPLERDAALQVTTEIAEALAHAHRAGVVHRDVKPENILRRADGSHALSDFGIARPVQGEAVTQEGVVIGTPSYMSPEQLRGESVDGRTDLYALGVVLFQLLTGRLPYQGTDGWSIGMQHLSAAIPRLPEHLADCQPLIDALMAKDRSQRPADGHAVAEKARHLQHASDALPMQTPATAGAPTEMLSTTARQGRMPFVRHARRWWLAACSALGVAAMLWFVWPRFVHSPVVDSDRSIAVLPFHNVTGLSDDSYFSDGLAETTLDALSRLPGLKVIARSSSFALRDQALDAREIGRRLGVAHLLEGSVQRAGDRVRITVQLVRSADGSRLWSRRYDSQLTDVFAIQDEIANSVVAALSVRFGAGETADADYGSTRDLEAYESYLRGNALLRSVVPAELRTALAHFDKAIAHDAGYARAKAGAATALILLSRYDQISPNQRERVKVLVAETLAQAPQLGEIHIAQAELLRSDLDFVGAENAFARGVTLAPAYSLGWEWYAHFLDLDIGDPQRVLEMLEKALTLDPLSPTIITRHARALSAVGRLDEAENELRELLATQPNVVPALSELGVTLVEKGHLVDALQINAKAQALRPGNPAHYFSRCRVLADFGALAEADACLETGAARFGRTENYYWVRAYSQLREGQWAQSLAAAAQREAPPWEEGVALTSSGNPDAALGLYQRVLPDLLDGTPAGATLGYLSDALDVGLALRGAGRTAEAQALFTYGLQQAALREHFAGRFSKRWWEAGLLAAIGRPEAACDSMQAAMDGGYITDFGALDHLPALQGWRDHPCFAPLRQRLAALQAAQVQQARDAGLLDAS